MAIYYKNLVLFPLLMFFCGSAIAQNDDKYEDWLRVCEHQGVFSGQCYISQHLTLKETGKDLFSMGIGYPLNNQYPLMLLSAPLGVFLPPGITFAVDSLQKTKAVLAYCNTAGCHAYYRMTPKLLKEFKQGRWLNITFVDGTRKAHHFQVSLNGFTQAIQSLVTTD